MTPEQRGGEIANKYWYADIPTRTGIELFNALKMDIADAIRAAVLEEREACARVAENFDIASGAIAQQIRERNNHD